LSHCIHLVLNSHASTRFISTLSLHDALPIFARSYDESIRESRKTIEMDPGFALAHNQLGEAYLQKHMHHEAVDELQKAVQLSGRSPTCMANLARAYVASGQKSEAVKLLDDLKNRSAPGDANA